MGWRNRDISKMFVAETLYASLIGGVLGCIIGWLISFVYSQKAQLKLPESLNQGPACRTTAPPSLLTLSTSPSALILLAGIAAAVIVGVVAGLVASRRAASLDPVVALRRL